MTRSRLYRNGVLERRDLALGEVPKALSDPQATVWLDVSAPTPAELAAIGQQFNLHHLAVEDLAMGRQHPKLVRYSEHLYIAAHEVRAGPDLTTLVTHPVAAFATPQALITVRPDGQFDIDAVVAYWDGSPDLANHGVSALLYGLLDFVVDSHFAGLESLEDATEGLEDLLFAERPQGADVQRRSFLLRKDLALVRRAAVPMREVLNSLLRRDLQIMDDAMFPYYQDVYDHVLRVTEWAESLRESVASVLETNLAIQGNRLNDIMKKVTSWAAIIGVPTAITGFYGQNVPYPGFAEPAGFWVSTSAILLMSVGLYLFFRRRDWI